MKTFSELSGLDYPKNSAEKWKKLREEFVFKVTSSEEKLDTAGVRSFVSELGLPAADLYVLDKPGWEMALKLFKDYNYHFDFSKNFDVLGAYYPEINVSIVKRFALLYGQKTWESINGPVIIESFAVHELAHASIQNSSQNPLTRTGFLENKGGGTKGVFFEEGFSEMTRAKYLKAKGISDHLITSNLGIEMPSTYSYTGLKGERSFLPISAAGYGLELLEQQIPGLQQHLLKARNAGLSALEFKNLIEKTIPGLFDELYNLQNNESAFKKGLVRIKSI